jgi:hypothetical protein
MTPSDEDLDCLLKAWTAPPSPDSLERRLRRAYQGRTGSRSMWTRWISGLTPAAGMFAGITTGALIFLLVIAEAFPQSLARLSGARSPFTLDYELIEYKADGSSVIREYFTSVGGFVVSREFPGDPLGTAGQRILDGLNLIVFWVATPVREQHVARVEAMINGLKAKNPELAKRIAERERTCLPGTPWTAIGNGETILNHVTKGIQKVWMEESKPVRFTEWLAPDLNCLTLKSTTEKTFDDGRLRPAFEQRALKVTRNAPVRRDGEP